MREKLSAIQHSHLLRSEVHVIHAGSIAERQGTGVFKPMKTQTGDRRSASEQTIVGTGTRELQAQTEASLTNLTGQRPS